MAKKKGKEKPPAEYGTFKYGFQSGCKNPIEFYHMYLERLKKKRRIKKEREKHDKKNI